MSCTESAASCLRSGIEATAVANAVGCEMTGRIRSST